MSDDLTLTAKISRTLLSLGDLDLNNRSAIVSPTPPYPVTGGYRIIRGSLGPGNVSWRRSTVDSPFVEGRSTVMAVKDFITAPIGVRCLAVSNAALTDVVQQVLSAFSQFYYTLEIKIDTNAWGTWLCEPADWDFGASGIFQDFHMRAFQQEIHFNVPRKPTPSAGAV